MTRLSALLVGVLLALLFFLWAVTSAPTAPALATMEYYHDPASALLDRQAQREHDERMAEIELRAYNDRMFWRMAAGLIVLVILLAVLGVVVAATARRSAVRRSQGDVYVLPHERHRLTG